MFHSYPHSAALGNHWLFQNSSNLKMEKASDNGKSNKQFE
jgi:hypothetical protein